MLYSHQLACLSKIKLKVVCEFSDKSQTASRALACELSDSARPRLAQGPVKVSEANSNQINERKCEPDRIPGKSPRADNELG
jgi:predicted kinase